VKENDSNKSLKQSRLLLCKAGQDEYVLDAFLADPACPVEVYGFHAQQAVEKLLKAILAFQNIAYGSVSTLRLVA
jgi:hypothetical protein